MAQAIDETFSDACSWSVGVYKTREAQPLETLLSSDLELLKYVWLSVYGGGDDQAVGRDDG